MWLCILRQDTLSRLNTLSLSFVKDDYDRGRLLMYTMFRTINLVLVPTSTRCLRNPHKVLTNTHLPVWFPRRTIAHLTSAVVIGIHHCNFMVVSVATERRICIYIKTYIQSLKFFHWATAFFCYVHNTCTCAYEPYGFKYIIEINYFIDYKHRMNSACFLFKMLKG